MSDIFDSNTVRTYKQQNKLNRYHNCRIDGDICDIDSLFFWFDQIDSIVPAKVEFFDGKKVSNYNEIFVTKIVSDPKLDCTYEDEVILRYYNSDYVRNHFRNLLGNTESFKSLVGKYIIDWSNNIKLINMLKNNSSEYIELNYFVNV